MHIKLLIVLFFSVVVGKAQTTTEKKQSTHHSVPVRILFDDRNAQLISIDSSGHVLENAIIAFQLFVNIKGVNYSEQALGSSLNKAMLQLLEKAESNTILYFEHIQLKSISGGLTEAPDFQYNLGYVAKPKKE
ncbi:MAG TPA: hypothetical protein VLB84_14095 [Bacteroidia bacterium]|jgi:hypothetical protein|nr:hypothetical protein [Bacteroidia bacterium]